LAQEWHICAGMNLFQTANQLAIGWVKEMMAELHILDPHDGLHALRAGLQAVRDRLTVEEAAQLSAQLPLLIRGIYFQDWDPAGKPLRIRHKEDFRALVRAKYAPRTNLAADDIVRAVFRVMSRHVSQGEITDIMMTLPEEIVKMAQGGPREESADV
jgi:uncharacterized protein (DUF2267 family)